MPLFPAPLRTLTHAICLLLSSLAISGFSFAAESNSHLKAVQVNGNAWAIVGEIDARTPENLGNNATFGFVVTDEGIVVIDSGAGKLAAMAIHKTIQTVSDKPIKYVINTGGQDHRWLGNEYFAKLGASIISSQAAKLDQAARYSTQWDRLEAQIGEEGLVGTKDHHADITFEQEYPLALGGTVIALSYAGAAHTAGDIFVWLPEEKVVYTGDIVYTERLLGVNDHSNSKSWLSAYDAMAALQAEHVVPGHGAPTTLEVANKDTRDYLVNLREKVAKFLDDGGDIIDINQVDQSEFKYLHNFDLLAGRNAQQVYTEMEFE